jgi:hypothetical protein
VSDRDAFVRDTTVDKPGIVGARWWQKGLDEHVVRRDALKAILIGGGVIAATVVIGGVVVAAATGGSSDYEIVDRPSLDVQREYGWDFGAVGEKLVFNGASTEPFDRAALDRLGAELAPKSKRLAPFYVPTLFDSLAALARSSPREDPKSAGPLHDALTPILTDAMKHAFTCGQALAAATRELRDAALVIVDLDGPEAVAFAAGASAAFDPVFAFDNWPHPRGVAAAHLTVAAAAYYQPMLAAASAPDRAPLFVLDRQRTAAYSDDSDRFDNRHLARMPTVDQLRALGGPRLAYVVPSSLFRECDDLNDLLSTAQGSFTHMVTASLSADFDNPGGGVVWQQFSPTPRAGPYSSGQVGGHRPAPPTGYATTGVVVHNGFVLGSALSRSGSWNRAGIVGGG